MVNKITLFLFSVLWFCSYRIHAQAYNESEIFLKRNSVWAFGEEAGLDFNSGQPIPIQTAINSVEACASVADTSGELLFYLGSDGTIWNRDHIPMQNGTGMYPYHPSANSSSSSQGAVIVPVIDTPWKYYVFINTQFEGLGTISPPYLTYSVVDMSLDNSLGGVESGRKNIPLYNYSLMESMIAIPGDQCDVWLLTVAYKYSGDPSFPNLFHQYFLAWHITPEGIDPDPVYSNPNSAFDESPPYHGNIMSVSPNRQKIALGLRNGVLLAKFDPLSGIVSEGLILPTYKKVHLGKRSYGTCFSPDNSKLYTATTHISGVGCCSLLQYDISTHDSSVVITSEYPVTPTWSSKIRSLKLYRDTIYTSASYSDLGRINNPNAAGIGCDYEPEIIPILPLTSNAKVGLPTEVVSPKVNYVTELVYDTICYIEAKYASMSLEAPTGFSHYLWDNGISGNSRIIDTPGIYWVRYRNSPCMNYIDTFRIESVSLDFSLGQDTTMIFCDHPQSYLPLEIDIPQSDFYWQDGSNSNSFMVLQPGTYWVEVTKAGCSNSDTLIVRGVELEDFEDIILCKGEPIDFTYRVPPVSAATRIQWSTGSTESSIHVSDSGQYWVHIIQPPCVLSDSMHIQVEVCECYTQIANAFSPNRDGINDMFAPLIESGCPVSNYVLNIYNRFGQRVYYSPDPSRGWDGNYNGKPADVGTYFYEVYFTGGTIQETHYRKGDVTLLR